MIQTPDLWTPRPRGSRRICAPPPPPPPLGIGTKQPVNTLFTPPDLGKCVLWARADQGITISTGISSWGDLSGNDNNLLQATGADQPTFRSSNSSLNGRPSVTFNGSTQKLQAILNQILVGGYSMFAVVVTGASLPSTETITGTPSGNIGTCGIHSSSWYNFTGTAFNTAGSPAINTAYVVANNISATNTTNPTIWVNSSGSPILGSQAGGGYSANASDIGVGAVYGSVNYWLGDIAEVAVYNTYSLTNTQVALLFGYAGTWYNQAWS